MQVACGQGYSWVPQGPLVGEGEIGPWGWGQEELGGPASAHKVGRAISLRGLCFLFGALVIRLIHWLG